MIERKERSQPSKNYSPWAVTERDFDLRDIGSLLQWAVLAPSTHNTQPWKFSVQVDSIYVSPDLQRNLKVSDPTGREMYLSLGAAVGNLKVAAKYFGLDPEEKIVENQDGTVGKVIRFKPGHVRSGEEVYLFEAITKRVSNRNPHQANQEIPPLLRARLSRLEETGLKIHLLENRGDKAEIASLVYKGTRQTLSDRKFTGELAEWVRPNSTDAPDGMPGFGFGMGDLMSKLFVAGVRVGGSVGAEIVAKDDKKLIEEGTTTIGVISTEKDDPGSWMKVGEKFEELALLATHLGLSANALAVLIETGDYYKNLQKIIGIEYRPQLMFRFGYPTAQTRHAPRRQAEQVIEGRRQEEKLVAQDRPTLFKFTEGVKSLDDLRKELEPVQVNDTYEYWLSELFMIRNPQIDFRTREGQEALNSYIGERNSQFDGVWVYYPWRKALLHIPKEEEFLEIIYSRNYPNFSLEEQRKLGELRVGIAGLSVGRNIALAAVMTGIRHLKIADFDIISPSNLNRMGGVSTLDIGRNKAESLAQALWEFNPELNLEVYPGGLDDSNLPGFMKGLEVLVEEVDDIRLKIKIREEARRQGVIVVMAADLHLTPTFDIELPQDPNFFGRRVTREVLEGLRKGPESSEEWVKMAAQVMGVENMPVSVLKNFIAVSRKEMNYGSQLGPTCLAVAAQIGYLLYEIARGNAGKLVPFKRLQLGQESLFDRGEDEKARKDFVGEFYG